jgi:hypothetical protein
MSIEISRIGGRSSNSKCWIIEQDVDFEKMLDF